MTWVILHRDLPGFPDDNTLQINYIFPDGIQTVSLPKTTLYIYLKSELQWIHSQLSTIYLMIVWLLVCMHMQIPWNSVEITAQMRIIS